MDSIVHNREDGGRLLRSYWLQWAYCQPNPKPSWLLRWSDLAESDKEADRYMWEHLVAPYHASIQSLSDTLAYVQEQRDRALALCEQALVERDLLMKEKEGGGGKYGSH